MPSVPTAPIVASGLVSGFAVARYTGRRALGGVVLVAAGAWCARSWSRSSGAGVTALLLATYTAAFGASHPLARKLGAWPSVWAVSGVASGAAYLLADRHSVASS